MNIRIFSIARCLFAVFLVLMGLLPSATVARSEPLPSANGQVWNLYTNANYINGLAVEGNTLWAATAGGLVQWNVSTGAYLKYHPTTSSVYSSKVDSVFIDGVGKKWFGAGYYANTFDGLSWDTLPDLNWAVDFTQDSLGNLWVATNGYGIKKFDGFNWTVYNTSNSGLASNYTTAIAAEGDTLWIGTYGEGINKFDGGTWTTYFLGSGDWIENMINDIAVSPNGTKWFAAGNPMGWSGGGGGSLSKLEGTTLTSYTDADSDLASSYVFAVAVDASNAVWAGTEGGVSKFDGATWTNYEPGDGLADWWVTSIFINGSDLWFGTNGGGISRFNGATWTSFKTTDRLPHNTIFSLGVQGENVWFSGGDLYVINAHNGVTKYDGATWTDYLYGHGLTTPEVRAMAADSSGAMWFGGWNVNKFDGINWEEYNDPYANGIVQTMAIDGNNKWFFMYEPFGPNQSQWVSKFNGSTWTAYTTSDGLVSTPVNSIAVNLDHSVWFATNNGVSKLAGSVWATYTTGDGLAHDKVYAVAVDPSGNAWFGTDGGVSKFNGTTWTTYTTANGLANNSVRAIAIDPSGNLWFGTSGGGVSTFDSSNWVTYNTANSGLASNYVYKIVITSTNHKWFYTNQGVNEFYSLPPILETNHTAGAPGSYYNITGRYFTPNQTVILTVNGHTLGSASTDANGAFTTTLSTSVTTAIGTYFVSATYTPPPPDGKHLQDPFGPITQAASIRFDLKADQLIHPREGDFTVVNIPDGISWQTILVPVVRR